MQYATRKSGSCHRFPAGNTCLRRDTAGEHLCHLFRAPRPQGPPEPPPAGVLFHRYPTLSKVIPVCHLDAYKPKNGHAQEGSIQVSYFFTGYRNVDSNGDVQSDILVVELAVDASPAGSGDLVTRQAGLNPTRYLGWFQESIIAGLNYQRTDDLLLLGTTPNTVNRTGEESSTKGFSIDIGYEVGATKPTLGLSFKNEVSTTTKFTDWDVGEQTSLFKPDIRQNDVFVETVRWQYAVAHPYNGLVDRTLLYRTPDTAKFTPQSTAGFDFYAATALEIPAGSPASRSRKLTLDAVLGWTLKYYYNGTGAFQSAEFRVAHWLAAGQSQMMLDLTPIATASAGGQNG